MRAVVISHTYVVAANRGKLEALARAPGVEIKLLVPRHWTNRDIGQTLRAPSTTHPFETAALPAWSGGFAALLTYSPFVLQRALSVFRPDLVHLEEEPWSVAALEVALVCARRRVPFIFFTWENSDRRLPPPFEWIRRAVTRRAAAAVAGNAEAKRLLEQRGFAGPVHVLPQLGVDPGMFFPAQPAGGPEDPVVGFVGRLVPQKGLLVLLDAVARLPKRVRVLIVGDGPLRHAVRAHARLLGLEGCLELHGAVGHDAVATQLRRMSVLVLPSLSAPTWNEQFGHVLIEAMACGVPVIGSDSGAIPAVIGEAGIVVREGDPAALAGALGDLLSHPTRRIELAARGRARVLAAYTNEAVAQQLLAAWRTVGS
ncbi:MAG TPA: glycosyltransferase [Gemmatimonadales bacterium]|jgi:glycosyltransferase involved in cell wall biosynthesis|nr:glycosyltransferase [Gemmatimonadales bacterium]